MLKSGKRGCTYSLLKTGKQPARDNLRSSALVYRVELLSRSDLSPALYTMTKDTKLFHLPDTLADWPWPRMINSHYEECKKESNAWLQSFKAFSPQSQYAFEKCDFGDSTLSNVINKH